MTKPTFNPHILTDLDQSRARRILGPDKLLLYPDLVIAPDGVDYLYRWFVLPYDPERGEVYLHVQVASDPERPLHDHPWDNQSVILAGGYEEILQTFPPHGIITRETRKPGDVVQRKAKEAHRLILPDGIPYTMSLFTTGPATQDWGFWAGNEKISHTAVTENVDGKSVWKDNDR